jgi:photosystem II stability/assembly factor-like uncharacterized protein
VSRFPPRSALRRLAALPLLLFVGAAVTPAVPSAAQPVFSGGFEVAPLPLGAENGVSNLHAEGTRLYAGPDLVVTEDGRTFTFLGDDPAFNDLAPGEVALFSLDVEGEVIWTGLGYTDEFAQDNPQTAAGFVYSTDGGETWTFRFPQLDTTVDTTLVYGVSTLEALPVVVPQQSPPFDLDYDPRTDDVWVAGFASGLRRSSDDGRTWERIVLPPDTADAIHPQSPYDFLYAPIDGGLQQNGFVAFSVLVDEAGTVWAGTAAGVARSDSADIDAASGDRAWRRYHFDNTALSIPSDFVVSIEEEPVGDAAFPVGAPENPRNPVWIISWPADSGGDHGLTVWLGDDAGGAPVLETRLVTGSRIFDTAFDGPRVYVAGNDGLYVSEDEGATWRTVTVFPDADGRPLPLGPTGVFAVAVTEPGTPQAALWAGTVQGILKSTDGGQTWTVFRVNVPPAGAGTEEAPEVEAYAYPNPFTPGADGFCRIRFDASGDGSARVRVFDFGMRLVRTLDAPARAGANEALWDGLSEDGTRVANGVYLYVIEAGGTEASGKILVLE